MKEEKTRDEIVQELFDVVQKQKAEISKAEKPTWLTNCSFAMEQQIGRPAGINLRVVSGIEQLVEMVAFIISKERDIKEANEFLDVTDVAITWYGFSFADWKTDIKTRLSQIQITESKKKCELLEARLDKLVSKEMREELELKAIQKELGL